jgi:hypothetical protein
MRIPFHSARRFLLWDVDKQIKLEHPAERLCCARNDARQRLHESCPEKQRPTAARHDRFRVRIMESNEQLQCFPDSCCLFSGFLFIAGHRAEITLLIKFIRARIYIELNTGLVLMSEHWDPLQEI